MNKSILIVICDFMIVSLISLINFENADKNDVAPEPSDVEVLQTFSDSQLVDLLKVSLDAEQKRREELDANIGKLSDAVKQSKEVSENQKKLLLAREKELAELAKTKKNLELEKKDILTKSQNLEDKVKLIDSRNTALQTEILAASKRLDESSKERISLEKKLGDMREVDSSSQAKLRALQEELKRNSENLDSLRSESEKLKTENRAMELEKHALATQLEVASTKSQIYEENLRRTQALVDIEKSEKQKIQEHADILAVGVGELAQSQQKITKNIEQLRPHTASEIFETVKGNLVAIRISYTQKGLFGLSNNEEDLRAVPVLAGEKIWLIANTSGTVLYPVIGTTAQAPETLSITVFGKKFKFSPKNMLGVLQDPRFIAIPVPAEFVEKESLKLFQFSQEAFKFSDCVVIEPKRLYYGQTPFKVDSSDANYVEMDVGVFQALFGDFSPSKGDIVMSRSGEFLGCMLNSSNALLIRDFSTLSSIQLGAAYNKDSMQNFISERIEKLKNLKQKYR